MHSIAGEFYGAPNRIWNALLAGFKDRHQMGQIVNVRKVDAPHDHYRFDGFLCGLLCIEAQVL